MSDPVLVEVVRNGFVESVHTARAVVVEPGGRVAASWGDVAAPIYPRSALKPLQAIGMLTAGLDLDGALLALGAASHLGEPFHVAGVRTILAEAGLAESDLQNTPDLPADDRARADWLRAGHGAASVTQNCSGKHAAMLRTAVRLGADPATYRDGGHPVQRAIRDAIAELSGEPAGSPGVDGCGAPCYAISVVALARAFGRIAEAGSGPAQHVADAYRAHPEYMSGTRSDECALHRGVPGLVCKGGAEAVYAVGLPDGRGVALKITDGSSRARMPLMAAILRFLGLDHPVLDAQLTAPVLGHGEPVGAVRALPLE